MSTDVERPPGVRASAPMPPAPGKATPNALRRLLTFEITKKKVPRRELMHFSRQLSVFVRAGIPMLEALEAITEEMGNKPFKAALEDVQDRLRSGDTFSSAAVAHPEAFPVVYANILSTAEFTGNLDQALDRISVYIERDLEARRKVKEALFYPAIVFCLSIVVVVILTAFVIPRFETFFKSFNAKLPLPTRMLLSIAAFVTSWWPVMLGGLVALVVIAVLGVRTERGRSLRDGWLLKLPVVGDLVQHAILERFCRILSAMVLSGVPLPDALAVTSAATNNAVFRRGLAVAREGMLRGEGLAGPMSATKLFPAAARQMFRVGEATGTLDSQLEVAAGYFDRELDYRLARFTSLFEPAVILFAGLFVGFVAIAMISAMYGIYRQVHIQ